MGFSLKKFLTHKICILYNITKQRENKPKEEKMKRTVKYTVYVSYNGELFPICESTSPSEADDIAMEMCDGSTKVIIKKENC
jgi:hypothetical protein